MRKGEKKGEKRSVIRTETANQAERDKREEEVCVRRTRHLKLSGAMREQGAEEEGKERKEKGRRQKKGKRLEKAG